MGRKRKMDEDRDESMPEIQHPRRVSSDRETVDL